MASIHLILAKPRTSRPVRVEAQAKKEFRRLLTSQDKLVVVHKVLAPPQVNMASEEPWKNAHYRTTCERHSEQVMGLVREIKIATAQGTDALLALPFQREAMEINRRLAGTVTYHAVEPSIDELLLVVEISCKKRLGVMLYHAGQRAEGLAQLQEAANRELVLLEATQRSIEEAVQRLRTEERSVVVAVDSIHHQLEMRLAPLESCFKDENEPNSPYRETVNLLQGGKGLSELTPLLLQEVPFAFAYDTLFRTLPPRFTVEATIERALEQIAKGPEQFEN